MEIKLKAQRNVEILSDGSCEKHRSRHSRHIEIAFSVAISNQHANSKQLNGKKATGLMGVTRAHPTYFSQANLQRNGVSTKRTRFLAHVNYNINKGWAKLENTRSELDEQSMPGVSVTEESALTST